MQSTSESIDADPTPAQSVPGPVLAIPVIENRAMTVRWWLYVVAFVLSIALVVTGLSQANTNLTFAGILIGAVLFFARKYIK